MKRLMIIVFVMVVMVGRVANSAIVEKTAQRTPQKKAKFGVGFQYTFPACGLSGIMDVTPNTSIQGIFGFFGDLKMFAGKGIYRFKKEHYWNIYGYGEVGVFSITGYGNWRNQKIINETSMGFSTGAGIEYGWQALSPNLPPVWWNFELGLGTVMDYGFPTMFYGCGAHYRF